MGKGLSRHSPGEKNIDGIRWHAVCASARFWCFRDVITLSAMMPSIEKLDRLGSKIALATVALLALIALFAFSRINGSGSLVAFVALWAFALILATIWICAKGKISPYGQVNVRMIVTCAIFGVVAALLVEGGTLLGTHPTYFDIAPFSSFVKNGVFRVAINGCVVYSCILLFLCKSKHTVLELCRRLVRRLRVWVIPKRIIVLCCIVLLCCVFAIVSRKAFGLSFRVSLCFCAATCASVAYVAFCVVRKKTTPSGLFLALSLPWVLFFACCAPAISGLSWDDQIHYANAQDLSYVINAPAPSVESSLYNPLLDVPALNNPHPLDKGYVLTSEMGALGANIDYLYPTSELLYVREGVGSVLGLYTSVGYIPSAAALWFGRLLHLPVLWTYTLGRCANALFYVLVTYASIRIIPCKKMLLCVVGLLPGALFLASNYSYDSWVICMLFLMSALVVKAITSKDGSIGAGQCAAMLSVGLLSIGPKAIYFLMLLMMLFVPKSKFASRDISLMFRVGVVYVTIIAACSFAIPFVISGGAAYTDTRINQGVDPMGQLVWILQNPLPSADVLLGFVFGSFIGVGSFDGLSYSFAYMSDFAFSPSCLSLLLVVVAACTDSDRVSNRLAKARYGICTVCAVLTSILLIVASLYLSFTPVGYSTVDGVQPRYLTPLVFPLFLFVLNPRIINVSTRWKGSIALAVLMVLPFAVSCANGVWLFTRAW